MAKVRGSAAVGGLSGKVGNMVFAQTENGTILRSVPNNRVQESEARLVVSDGLRVANRLWREMTDAQFEAWAAYARSLTEREPATGLPRSPKAVNVFTGLTIKFVQLHGGFIAPLDPPSGLFLGDVISFSLEAQGLNMRLTSSGANRPGVVTEVLAQRLGGRHNSPRPRSYKSYGFHAFSGAGDTFEAHLRVGTWMVGIKFLESASGRATRLIPVGRVTILVW